MPSCGSMVMVAVDQSMEKRGKRRDELWREEIGNRNRLINLAGRNQQ